MTVHRMKGVAGKIGSAACVLAIAGAANADVKLGTQLIASGLSRPLYVTAPTGDTSRMFIVEQRISLAGVQTGRIRIFDFATNSLLAAPYLQIAPLAGGNEQGLLGLAFHPDFANNGYFYVNYTRTSQAGVSAGSTIVARYRATGGNPAALTADPASATILLTIPQPDTNHNGGWISFGPDGNLYIATGDGGCFNDATCVAPNPPSVFAHTAGGNAQDLTSNLLGKMLRIDVDGADNIPGNADDADPVSGKPYRIPAGNPFSGAAGDPEIFMNGLRNPWRNDFDNLTGDLWIADVGQGAREEISFVPAGAGAGWNFGWRCLEGTRNTGLSGCNPADPTLRGPILEYGHDAGTAIGPTTMTGCSITGGVVYRGTAIPCLSGTYLFADYCAAQIWSFRRSSAGAVVGLANRTAEIQPTGTGAIAAILSFGEDASGEAYICDQNGGRVFRIVPNGFTGLDCNNNASADDCDIRLGTSTDTNSNSIPDDCECDSTDFNGDGVFPDNQDIIDFIDVFGGAPCPTGNCNDIDFNNDGIFPDNGDIVKFLEVFAGSAC
jgi:glucose/arabinose dehydrogenase